MKLLFDQNLAPRLTTALAEHFPESEHVRNVGLARASDLDVWEYAGENGFALVSKDSDFQQLSFLHGAPPKVISIRRGNCSVREIIELLATSVEVVKAFNDDGGVRRSDGVDPGANRAKVEQDLIGRQR